MNEPGQTVSGRVVPEKNVPERMCVICRQRFAKKILLRHILDDAGRLMPDIHQVLPGRGWYVCANENCRARFEKFRPRTGKKKGPEKNGPEKSNKKR